MVKKISCPCTEYVFIRQVNQATTYDHLVVSGIMHSYDNWFCHRESQNGSENTQVNNHSQLTLRDDDTRGMIHDVFESFTHTINSDISERNEMKPNIEEIIFHPLKMLLHLELDKFEWPRKEVNEELYTECKKFSKSSFLLHIYHIKCLFKWSNESFDS